MRKIYLLLVFTIFIQISCTAISLKELKEQPYCQTAIEGYYHSERIYTGKTPVLFKKKWNKKALPIFGQIIEIHESGVTFLTEGKALSSGDTIYYKFTELDALVGSKNNIIYGTIPNKYLNNCEMTLFFFNTDDPDKQIFEIDLEPNTSFGFCLNPGKYQIESITFANEHDVVDQAINFGTLNFDVFEGVSNYIGDIYLDNPVIEGQKIVLPYKNIKNPIMRAGATFGLIGGLAAGLSVDYVSLKNTHILTLVNNEEFKSSSHYKLKSSFFYSIDK